MGCKWVETLKGQRIAFTGKVFVRDQWVIRDRCVRLAAKRGAVSTDHVSSSTDIVVWGDLASQVVADPTTMSSQKLLNAAHASRHVHVITADGFADLLHGGVARCIRVAAGGTYKLPADDTTLLFGGPLRVHQAPRHKANQKMLRVDLDALDDGTQAHRRTLAQLRKYLANHGIEALHCLASGPRFDAGWRVKGRSWIAEVKSLSNTNETQQLRLGLGQLLEYRARAQHNKPPRAALILSRAPSDDEWMSICEAVDVLLTWAPGFAGILD